MATETQKPLGSEVLDKLNWVPGEVAVYEGRLLFKRAGAIHALGVTVSYMVDVMRWLEEPADAEEAEV